MSSFPSSTATATTFSTKGLVVTTDDVKEVEDDSTQHLEAEMKELSVSPLMGPTKSSSVELPESKTTELDEEQVVCKNPTDFNAESVAKPYYNANPMF